MNVTTSSHSEPKMSKSRHTNVIPSAAPLTGQQAHEIQAFGTVVAMPLALAEDTRRESATNLNQLLADTITLRDLYKKHHWQVSGPTFYQLHLLFDTERVGSIKLLPVRSRLSDQRDRET
jgi:hypothetical protein